MENRCISCGDCCECIALGCSLDDVMADKDFPDRDFVLKHWTPIERPTQKLNPLMPGELFRSYCWFACDSFDAVSRKCRYYENRPQICKDYPNGHKSESLMSKRCGFYMR